MRKQAFEIPLNILAILQASTLEGNTLTLPGQMDRKTYQVAAEVIERAGGKWNKSKKCHVFTGSLDALHDILNAGKAPARNALDFYATPDNLADQMIDLADVENAPNDAWFLEPSAGNGEKGILPRLAKYEEERGYDWSFNAYEIDHARAESIQKNMPDVRVFEQDFLTARPERIYHRILMNPPFNTPERTNVYIDHIMHAYNFLETNGVLVSVVAKGVEFREDKRIKEFREFVEDHGRIFEVEGQVFTQEGTGVNVSLIRLA
jgi:predicted RNA methylase